jgi:hypothetical protein
MEISGGRVPGKLSDRERKENMDAVYQGIFLGTGMKKKWDRKGKVV